MAPAHDVGHADPGGIVLPAVASRRDPLRARQRCRELRPLPRRHEVEEPLDLIGAGDDEPVRVDGRLRRSPDLQASNDSEVAEQAQDPVYKLPTDGAVLKDDARAAAYERPGAVAQPEAREQRTLVLLALVP